MSPRIAPALALTLTLALLAGCAGCTTYVEQMREIVRLTGMLTEEQVPAEHRERLRQAFRDWKAS